MKAWKISTVLACAILSLSACGKANDADKITTAVEVGKVSSSPQSSQVAEASPKQGGEPVQTAPPESLFKQLEDYPRVDGSTACLPLMSLVMQKTLGIDEKEAERYVKASKTVESYEKLLAGEADLLLAYESAEVDKTKLRMDAIGRDALVFFVNKDNPVDGITAQQAKAIYTGQLTNWQELGGKDAKIRAFQRNPDSGSQTLLKKLVLNGEEPMEALTTDMIGDMEGILEVIADYDYGASAIGFSVYYYMNNMKQDPEIKMLSIDGVYPSEESIASGEYPYLNPFYLVIRADESKGSAAQQLFNWMLGETGKACVKEAGYIPVAD